MSSSSSRSELFAGVKAYLIRENFEPEKFTEYDTVLKDCGATVAYYFDHYDIGSNDYYILPPNLPKEKFNRILNRFLRLGCRIIEPLCLISCVEKNKPLPNQSFTCCLAMEGIKLLTAGFGEDEKWKIQQLVTSMRGEVLDEPSSDTTFVIMKNVLATEYQWALNAQIPVVTLSWLHRCFEEHRIIPHDSYLIPPFLGLKICISEFSAAEREEMEKIVLQNGGQSLPELTSACTHFICVAPEGDKYKVARRLGNNIIVSRTWLYDSASSKACLDVKSYIVKGADDSSVFEGKFFRFGSSFPEYERPLIVDWIRKGSGMLVDDEDDKRTAFMIESHGSICTSSSVIRVSTQWIRSCLEDGSLHNIDSHVIYSPLRRHLHLSGFRRFTFCVTQHDEKDIKLLRNLCFIIGSKLVDTLTQNVTHLLCIYPYGKAYMAASEWGIPTINPDWIYTCVKEDRVVPPHPYIIVKAASSVRQAQAYAYESSSDSDSMVVSYAEDYSGRQQIIDRIQGNAAQGNAAQGNAAQENAAQEH